MNAGVDLMAKFTDLLGHGMFIRTTACADKPWCEGHVDDSVTSHGTEYDFFGPDGVVVTQGEGRPPMVSLIDFDPAQNDYTPAHARRIAFQILQAADLAERYAQPSATGAVALLLAETIAAETPVED
jgi:hypothetical protein